MNGVFSVCPSPIVCGKCVLEEKIMKKIKNCNFTVCYAKWGIYAILKHPSNGRVLTDIKKIFFKYFKKKRYSLFQFSSFRIFFSFYLWKYLQSRYAWKLWRNSKEGLSGNHAYLIPHSFSFNFTYFNRKKPINRFSFYIFFCYLCADNKNVVVFDIELRITF